MAPADAWGGLVGTAEPHIVEIVRSVRLPTVALALMVGAFLGASGAAMQGLLRNPLADPYLLGVSGGAALGVTAVLVTGATGIGPLSLVPLAAFAGAALAVLVIQGVSSAMPGGLRGPGATYTLLLTGVVFNALASAIILVVHAVLTPMKSQELLLWLMGALVPGRADASVWPAFIAGLAGIVAMWARAHRLNVLSLGDTQSQALGVDPRGTRTFFFLVASLVVGCAVAFSGMIGFVGLLVPHMVRLGFGADHRTVLPLSAAFGAAFLVAADALARSLFPLAGTALPVGAVTAVVGAPLFFVLLRRSLARGGVS